jgi:hypothetical protein
MTNSPLPQSAPEIHLSASGDVTVGGDVVGRDKIVNNIQNIRAP